MKAVKIRWNPWLSMVLIAVLSASVSHLLGGLPFFRLFALKAYDIEFELRGAKPTKDIVLIAADQKSFETFPELQAFWHPHYATAIKGAEMGGAKVIGLDLAFGIPVEKYVPGYDQMMAEAVASAQIPVVVGFVPALEATQHQWPIPVNMMASAFGNSAFANLTVDEDEFIRRQELIEAPQAAADPGTPLTRSLGMRIAERALGAEAVFSDGQLTLNGRVIPIGAQRDIAINYAGPPGTFPRVSLADFEAATKAGRVDQLKQWVGGKVVLLGTDADTDRFPTPFYPVIEGRSRWTTAGVEIHANTVNTLLTGDFILPAPVWSLLLVLLLTAAATYGVVSNLPPGVAAPAAAGVLIAGLSVSYAMFLVRHVMPASEIGASWAASLVLSIAGRFMLAERRRDHFRHAVAVFVGSKVAKSLEKTDEIGLSGTRSLVTIMFTDIRGFTAFCEDKDPAIVVELLNEYMSRMVSIIVKHHGQVNKFIGDGIMAIFSDDDGVNDIDHALRAVLCANEIVTQPSQFRTGAGIHTGLVVVGNVGSKDKMEYTVLGDAVNLASRLESLNKEKKTSVLISGATRAFVDGQIPLTRLGTTAVRGQSEPIELFTISSLIAAPVSHEEPVKGVAQ